MPRSLNRSLGYNECLLGKAAQDYLVFGNAYLGARRNVLGKVMDLHHVLTKYTCRCMVDGGFCWTPGIAAPTRSTRSSRPSTLRPALDASTSSTFRAKVPSPRLTATISASA